MTITTKHFFLHVWLNIYASITFTVDMRTKTELALSTIIYANTFSKCMNCIAGTDVTDFILWLDGCPVRFNWFIWIEWSIMFRIPDLVVGIRKKEFWVLLGNQRNSCVRDWYFLLFLRNCCKNIVKNIWSSYLFCNGGTIGNQLYVCKTDVLRIFKKFTGKYQ